MKMSSTISNELRDNLRTVLGKNVKVAFKCKVRMETKGDKTENKILVFSSCRLYIMSPKIPSKMEHNFHYLEIHAIESKKTNQLCFHIGEKIYTFYTIENEEKVVDSIIHQLILAMKFIFPLTPLELIIRKIDVSPQSRLQVLSNQMQENFEVGPCGGFSVQYACMCDYHGLPYRDEVAWDVDTIYLSHDCRELCLQDFDHLEPRDLIPIITVLEYNTWFTKFRASNNRLLSEAVEQILNVIRKSMCLEEIYLDNIGLRWEFVQRLSGALMMNANSVIHTIDLSNNIIEDKGAPHLVNTLIKLPKGLKHLNLARTAISAKGINMLANALAVNKFMASTLTHINLADNTLKEEVNNLYNFLAQPNTITHLDLSGTDVALDLLFGALFRGCSQKLSNLNLSRNPFSHKKPKDVLVPTTFKQFFATTVALRYLNLSFTKLPSEALKNMLLGLACNETTTNIELDLSSNNLGSAGAQVMEHCISDVRCLACLDISDNALDADLVHVVNAIRRNKFIRRLSIGRNFSNIKSKYMGSVLESIVQLLQEDDSTIEHLSVADSKLKNDIYCIINAVGSNQGLISIDISGNQMGDAGARLLAKALQINNHLKALFYDRNGITASGFFDLAYALQMNYTMRYIPCPVVDVCLAMKTNPDRTDAALKRIENLLHRNVSPKKYNNSQAFRLQQGFLLNSTQQMVDRLVVQTQDLIKTITFSSNDLPTSVVEAEAYLKDADKSKQLLTRLHNVILQREEPSTSIDLKLSQIAEELHRVIQNHIQGSVTSMIKCAEDQCPKILENAKLCQELQKTCQEKSNFPFATVQQIIVEESGTDLLNKVNELNLAVASHVSDCIVDEVIESLSKNFKTLTEINHNLKSGSNVTFRRESAESLTFNSSEKLDSPENTPEINNKRKTIYTRKLRPQSIVDTVDGVEIERMSSSVIGYSTDSPTDNSPQCLQHLGKARPKRPKTRAPTRANLHADTILEDEQNLNVGLDSFFQKSEPSTPVISPSSSIEFSKITKPDNKSQKLEKAQLDKKSTVKPESEKKEKSTRIVQELSNIFRRSSDKLSKSKSTEAVEKSKEVERSNSLESKDFDNESLKENLSASESNLRQPTAVPKVGVGDNILAEMKARQEKRISHMKDQEISIGASKTCSTTNTKQAMADNENNNMSINDNFSKDPPNVENKISLQRPASSPCAVSGDFVSKSNSPSPQLAKPKPPPIAPKPRPRSMISPDMRKSDEFSPMSDNSSFDGSSSTTPDHGDRCEDDVDGGCTLPISPNECTSPDGIAAVAGTEMLKRKAASLPRTATTDMMADSSSRLHSPLHKEHASETTKMGSDFHVDDVVDV